MRLQPAAHASIVLLAESIGPRHAITALHRVVALGIFTSWRIAALPPGGVVVRAAAALEWTWPGAAPERVAVPPIEPEERNLPDFSTPWPWDVASMAMALFVIEINREET